jgi:predicted nucleic acid-binding protein
MRVLLDSSCLVAAALPQHERHKATIDDLSRRRGLGHAFVIAAHSLLEAYAVLTRLPAPHRLSPADALSVLERNWGKTAMASLSGAETWRVIRRHGAAGIGGGRIYDGQIAASARKAKAAEILTWNVRHFGAVHGIRVLEPGPAPE